MVKSLLIARFGRFIGTAFRFTIYPTLSFFLELVAVFLARAIIKLI